MRSCSAQSFGRVVLTGEHSVVYGNPAVTSSINLGVTARFNPGIEEPGYKPSGRNPGLKVEEYVKEVNAFFVEYFFKTRKIPGEDRIAVESTLPIGSGLSSSTAVAAAVFKLVAKHFQISLSKQELFDLLVAFESQTYPVSGMDQAAVAFGGLQQFQKSADCFGHEPISTLALRGKTFWLIDSGRPQESTKEMVALVKENYQKNKKVLEKLGACSKKFIASLSQNSFSPELLAENHQLLSNLGVVGDKASLIVRTIVQSGGVAKISGAGGVKDGSGIILTYHPDTEKFNQLIHKKKWKSWEITLGYNPGIGEPG